MWSRSGECVAELIGHAGKNVWCAAADAAGKVSPLTIAGAFTVAFTVALMTAYMWCTYECAFPHAHVCADAKGL